jgi:hypothetical protein
VFVDFAVNDVGQVAVGERENGFMPCAEAIIRRLRTDLPATKQAVLIFTWPDNYSSNGDSTRLARDAWIAIANAYGIQLMRWDVYLEALLGVGYDDADVDAYLGAAGDVHPNDAGHAAAAAMIEAALTSLDTSTQISPLPNRIYAESEDYEQTPIIRNGNDNDGETGTWAGAVPARTSSTADSTISWTGTFCSFGWDATGGVIGWSVDGGSYTNIDMANEVQYRAVWNFARGEHTIMLKVISGTVTINRFMAI